MQPLIIYHSHCWDGLASAWVAQQAYPQAILHPAIHSESPPDVTGKDVYIVDFSYKRNVLERMAAEAKSLTVIDHHETAQKDLQGLDYCVFDLEKSGAGLTWDYFFPDRPRPWVINYVEDQDLWRFKFPNSKSINAGLGSHPRTLETFNRFGLLRKPESWIAAARIFIKRLFQDPLAQQTDLDLAFLTALGNPVIQYRDQLVERVSAHAKMISFEGYQVPFVNTLILQSEVGAKLAENNPFSITWSYQNGRYVYSLRSKDVHVGEIAAKYGGGGHPRSSGFQLDYLLAQGTKAKS